MTAGTPRTDGRRQRRPRRASTDVAVVMILAALVSALLVGAFNFVASRTFITEQVQSQLADIGSGQAARIERGLAALESRTSTLAIEPAVASALVELSDAFDATTEVLDGDQEQELRSAYEDGIELVTPPGVEPPPMETLVPTTDTARYLHYHYLVGTAPEDRRDIVDPGDGSPYSAVHARQHPVITGLSETLGLGEVLLIDRDGRVVYSRDKRIDFGTDLETGPYRDSAVAGAMERLETTAVGDVVTMDFERYLPARGLPELWLATAVRAGDETVGAIATAVPNEALVDVTTAGGDWASLGLGDTGEAYIVGSDGLMRSEARLWLEDPDAYEEALEDAGYPPELVDTVRSFETTVLVQPVDTPAVEEAATGTPFTGTIDNYLGRAVQSYAVPLDSGPLGWLAVTEVETAEIRAPLRDYIVQLALIAIVTVPIVIGIAIWLARRLLRPVDPIVDAASRIADGDIDVTIGMRGNDEFADVARQLDLFADELRRRRLDVERADRETTELLETVMPRRLVEQYRAGDRQIAESIRNVTLIAMTVGGSGSEPIPDDEMAEYNVQIAAGVRDLAQALEVDQILSSADTAMFATGLDVEGPEVERALDFAIGVRQWVSEFASDRSLPLEVGIGLAAGDVVAHLVGTERLSFEVLGAPRSTAEGLARAAESGTILVDAGIAARLPASLSIERVDGVHDLDGALVESWRLVDAAVSG